MNNHQRSAYKGSAADSLAQFPDSAFILVCPQGTSQNKRGKLMYGFFEASQRKPQRLGLNVCFSSSWKMLSDVTRVLLLWANY